MDPAHEARQMAEVKERLEARFPDLDPTLVEAAIQVAAAGITGPIRDFVPLLVERAARERLNRAVAGGTMQQEQEQEQEHGEADPDRAAAQG